MIAFLISGIVYGATAGISPGPLLAFVIRESIAGGKLAGVRAALAPLLTDIPIVVLSLGLLATLSNSTIVPAIISFAGAAFLIYLSFETLLTKPARSTAEGNRRTFMKAALTNILSPHPYMFWLLVGAPTTLKAAQSGAMYAVAFVFGFYLLLIGSKIIIALLAAKSKDILKGKGYLYVMRFLGAALFIFAALLIRDGIGYLR